MMYNGRLFRAIKRRENDNKRSSSKSTPFEFKNFFAVTQSEHQSAPYTLMFIVIKFISYFVLYYCAFLAMRKKGEFIIHM